MRNKSSLSSHVPVFAAAVVLAIGVDAGAADNVDLKGSAVAVVDRDVPYVYLTDRAKVTLESGAKVSFLDAKGNSEVVVEDGAKVSHLNAVGNSEVVVEDGAEVSNLTLTGHSVVRIFGGRISNLSILENAQAHLHRLRLEGGGLYGSTFSGSGIIYDPEAQIHFHADIISVDFGIVRGLWSNGERFSVGLVEKATKYIYRRPESMPRQMVVHEVPGPAFDCKRAATGAEKMVCADQGLARLDKQLAKVYAQTLAAAVDAPALRRAQTRWLRERDKCANRACIEAAYQDRIRAIDASGEMTNRRAQAICDTVMKAVNDGSIAKRFLPFEQAKDEDEKRWRESHYDDYLNLSQTLKITQKGKTRALGMLYGGGTCSSCEIVDVNAREIALYPPDDEKERLRWASWGACDYVLMVEDEAVVVTGSFGFGRSRASLVAWIAPDGAKRALCYLAPSGDVDTRVARSDNQELCSAVTAGKVDAVPWVDSVIVEDGSKRDSNLRSDGHQAAEFDIDTDGKKDMIIRFEYASGAGRGSFSQWLEHAVKKDRPAKAIKIPRKPDESEQLGIGFPAGGDEAEKEEEAAGDSYVLEESPLGRVLRDNISGPIEGSKGKDGLFSLKMFSFHGKPYILGRGAETSASVVSVWGGKPRTWCNFDLLPQHKVAIYYPIETWPASGVSH